MSERSPLKTALTRPGPKHGGGALTHSVDVISKAPLSRERPALKP
jgi:hypothetical protein